MKFYIDKDSRLLILEHNRQVGSFANNFTTSVYTFNIDELHRIQLSTDTTNRCSAVTIHNINEDPVIILIEMNRIDFNICLETIKEAFKFKHNNNNNPQSPNPATNPTQILVSDPEEGF